MAFCHFVSIALQSNDNVATKHIDVQMATIDCRKPEKPDAQLIELDGISNEAAVSPQSHSHLVAAARRLNKRSALASFKRFCSKLRHWIWYLIEELLEVGQATWSTTRCCFAGSNSSTINNTIIEPHVAGAGSYPTYFKVHYLALKLINSFTAPIACCPSHVLPSRSSNRGSSGSFWMQH